MSSIQPKPVREVLPETGAEPEYFMPTPYKAELIEGSQDVRVYWGIQKGRVVTPMFTVVGPVAVMARNSKLLMEMSAEAHNIAQWALGLESETERH